MTILGNNSKCWTVTFFLSGFLKESGQDIYIFGPIPMLNCGISCFCRSAQGFSLNVGWVLLIIWIIFLSISHNTVVCPYVWLHTHPSSSSSSNSALATSSFDETDQFSFLFSIQWKTRLVFHWMIKNILSKQFSLRWTMEILFTAISLRAPLRHQTRSTTVLWD